MVISKFLVISCTAYLAQTLFANLSRRKADTYIRVARGWDFAWTVLKIWKICLTFAKKGTPTVSIYGLNEICRDKFYLKWSFNSIWERKTPQFFPIRHFYDVLYIKCLFKYPHFKKHSDLNNYWFLVWKGNAWVIIMFQIDKFDKIWCKCCMNIAILAIEMLK